MLLDVRYPGGRETTVCIRDLCPCPASLCPPVNPCTSNVSDVSHTFSSGNSKMSKEMIFLLIWILNLPLVLIQVNP